MRIDDRAVRWRQIWEERRQRILHCVDVGGWPVPLPHEALAILEEARELAAAADLPAHAAAPVDRLIERINALPEPLPLLLHRPVASSLSMLRLAAQEVLSSGTAPGPAAGAGRFDWFLFVGDEAEMVELVRDCAAMLTDPPAVRVAATEQAAIEELRRDGSGMVVTGLVPPTARGGPGAPGLRVARRARRGRHSVLLVTAASDYLAYWPQLAAAGLTGYDVLVKTRPDFAARFVRRVLEIAEPRPLRLSFVEGTGHVVRIGDIEVADLDAREELVLRQLDHRWRTPASVAAACGDETMRAPDQDGVRQLVSRLRRKLTNALVAAESDRAQREVILSQRRSGGPVGYRLAPWLLPDEDAAEPCGPAAELPPVLVIEDDPDWALWVVGCLEELRWPASVAATLDEARRGLWGEELPVVVADLGLSRRPGDAADPELGLTLIEEVAARRAGLRVVVLTAFGGRDTVRARLFEAGVRTVDVIAKSAGRDECRAALLTSLQRAADEAWRGVRRGGERSPVHRVVRRAPAEIEVDGTRVALSEREARVVGVLFDHANQPVKAEVVELDFPTVHRLGHNPPLNKVQLTVSRLRKKIDERVGQKGTGESVIRTRHRRSISTYELYGVITDPFRMAE